MFQTEFEFTLPCGYLDEDQALQRDGVMRRATAADEILPLKDPRVVRNPAYLIVILLSRVVIRLGTVDPINPKVIEGLFATDLAYLQNLYNRVNRLEEEPETAICPNCQTEFVPGGAAENDPGGPGGVRSPSDEGSDRPGGFWATPSTASTGR